MLGSVVPGVGNVVGGAVGGIIGAGVGVYKGLAGRKKARREEARLAEEKREKITKFNTELAKNYSIQKGAVRAGNIRQKTYSGYDLGRNVVAQMGGMRMGMPRYGRAA
jgi:hypothetical protein